MSDKKGKGAEPGVTSNKKRKILADLHSGMVLLARFAERKDAPPEEQETSGSRRSHEVRQALNSPSPPSRHRWN